MATGSAYKSSLTPTSMSAYQELEDEEEPPLVEASSSSPDGQSGDPVSAEPSFSDDEESQNQPAVSHMEFNASEKMGGFPVAVRSVEAVNVGKSLNGKNGGSGGGNGAPELIKKENQWDTSRDIKKGSVSNLAASLFGSSTAAASPTSSPTRHSGKSSTFASPSRSGSRENPAMVAVTPTSESRKVLSVSGLDTVHESVHETIENVVTATTATDSSITSAESYPIPGSVLMSIGSEDSSPMKALSDLDISTVSDTIDGMDTLDGKSTLDGNKTLVKDDEEDAKAEFKNGGDDDSAIALLAEATGAAAKAATTAAVLTAAPSPERAAVPPPDPDAASFPAFPEPAAMNVTSEPLPPPTEEDLDKVLTEPLAQAVTEKPVLFFGQFNVDSGDPLHYSETETLLSAQDHWTSPPSRVILKLMKQSEEVLAELTSRKGLDVDYVVPVRRVFVDRARIQPNDLPYSGEIKIENFEGLTGEARSCLATRVNAATGTERDASLFPEYPHVLCLQHYNHTLDDVLAHDKVDLPLSRKIMKDVVVGLILLHTEQIIHGDIKPRSIVRVGTSWKLSDFQSSAKFGTVKDSTEASWGYTPPEVAATLFARDTSMGGTYEADSAYDLWSLGCILYHLVFGTALWNIDRNGKISSEDLSQLARWSPQSFLKKAAIRFPTNERTDDQKAAIDLICKLLSPTPDDRRSEFEFGIVSVHQHEFLAGKSLERGSVEGFEVKQNVMLKSEQEHNQYLSILKELRLEEQWELKRGRDVLLLGIFESSEIHTPTSFVMLKEKLPPLGTERDPQQCLDEAMRWVNLFETLGPTVKGALDGDVSSIGKFWGKIHGMFKGDYMYFYFIDELTGEPVRGDSSCSTQYPVEITTRSDLVPKLLPFLHLTMRSMALYHGVAGVARMFGATEPLTEESRIAAQGLINELKREDSPKPFGVIADDVTEIRNYKEQFLKNDSVRCQSLQRLVQFLEKKFGHDHDFAGLHRYPDESDRAMWTLLETVADVRSAVKKRADERLKEERNTWVDDHQHIIGSLQKNLHSEKSKVAGLENSLNDTKRELERSVTMRKQVEKKADGLNSNLRQSTAQLQQVNRELEEEKNKAKCCVVQ